MNLFNCYQALALFAATPPAVQYLYMHDNQLLAIMLVIPWIVGFVVLGLVVNDGIK